MVSSFCVLSFQLFSYSEFIVIVAYIIFKNIKALSSLPKILISGIYFVYIIQAGSNFFLPQMNNQFCQHCWMISPFFNDLQCDLCQTLFFLCVKVSFFSSSQFVSFPETHKLRQLCNRPQYRQGSSLLHSVSGWMACPFDLWLLHCKI